MVAQNTKPPSDNLYMVGNALSVAIGFLGAVIARGSFPPGAQNEKSFLAVVTEKPSRALQLPGAQT